MKKYLLILIISCFGKNMLGQDLLCNVQVNADQIQISNKEIFVELENAITQFMNTRKWISDKVQVHEKIQCNFVINVKDFAVDQFSASVNITSSRPVYGTSYSSPIFQHFDQEFYFSYAQFQNLEYQDNSNVMDLTSLLAFYANVIIGLDMDTYHPEGGSTFYSKALQIRNIMQNKEGWGPGDGRGNRNKYYIIDQLLDNRFKPVRTALYQYHMQGMDKFKDDNAVSRKEIYSSLEKIRGVQENLPNSVIFKIIFNSKRQEIINIFKEAEPGLKNRAVELLGLLDPSNVSSYDKIR